MKIMIKPRAKANRIAVTVSDDLKQALDELQNVTGVAAASFVGEIMENSIPMIRGITESVVAAKSSTSEALSLLDQNLTRAFQELHTTRKLVRHKVKLRTFTREDSGQ